MRILIATFLAVLTASAATAFAADNAGTNAVYALNGAHKGSFMGSPCQVLDVISALNGRAAQICVPNDPPMGGYNPSPVVTNAIKDAKPGDLFQIKASAEAGVLVLNQIGRYRAKPGETAPNAFVFVDSKDDTGKTVVDVTCFLSSAALVVPNKKDDSGKPAPDPAMMAVINDLKEGDVVLVTATPNGNTATIVSIELWVAPSKAEFTRLDTADVNGEKRPVVVLSDAGADVTLQIPGIEKQGKWIPDPRIMAEVRKLKAKSAVEYHSGKDGDTVILKDITVATDTDVAAK